MKKIGIEIPCYNEEGNIKEIYTRIKEVMSNLPYEYKIVFIDNKSTDNSRKILKDIADSDSNVALIFNTRNFGAGNSGAYGFFMTPGDAVISLACDLQDPPELIPEFIEKWEKGYKVVLGRKTSSVEKGKKALSRKLYYKIMRQLISYNDLDQITGFGLYDKMVIQQLKIFNDPVPVFRYNISELGFDVAYIDYEQPARKSGHSSYNFFSYVDVTIASIINNSFKPIRYITYIGIVGFFAFTVINFVALILLIVNGIFLKFLNTFVLIILIQMNFFGIACLGVIGEYISDIHKRLKKRPLAVEEKRINLDE